ncbi:patatin-like phospholipase family protein [Noviherbaspirillum massiliense]|uniref:patatin-like phospholipase family protein n=1 Tax=Noviherbaspirillum massiliense TaxID=1465823 RepID=UPI0002D3D7C4|nr:patatin-like phospholipase family protein [Noviherbaspirillum massiliense]
MVTPNIPLERSLAPVHELGDRAPQPGIGLCLSGGGYRAMIFHLGALIRLNEAGLLSQLTRVSSVSGGSITAAVLGMKWQNLRFINGIASNLIREVIDPIRRFAQHTVDIPSIITGTLLPGTASDRVARAYSEYLYGDETLQSLPDDPPRFVINAANIQSGALVRFSKPYIRDYKVGEIRNPAVSLAMAVTASSAFPPVLSPAVMKFTPNAFSPVNNEMLASEEFRKQMVLSDGGVYDNLGLETVWKRLDTVLVSDAGMKFAPDHHPAEDWVRHSRRVLELIDNQVRGLRKRQLISAFQAGLRRGCYWGIGTDINSYGLDDALPCPPDRTDELAHEPTRLAKLPDEVQERLINWGYAVCDAAVRRYLDPSLAPPTQFPYASGV